MIKNLFIAVAALWLSACGQSNATDNAPLVDWQIDDQRRCHQCGMMITKYPGPKGMIALKDQTQTLAFCSTRDMFQFALQPQNARQISAIRVHDMATTDWQAPQDSAFIDATEAVYVYGTRAKGVMGPAVAPFSTQAAAEAHIAEFGGKVYQYHEITLALLGEHQHDHAHHDHSHQAH